MEGMKDLSLEVYTSAVQLAVTAEENPSVR